MSHIVIDGRGLRNSSGRYTRNLLDQLQKLDRQNKYTVIGLEEDFKKWQPTSKNFHTKAVNIPIYGFKEQLVMPFVLYKLKPDLVHFTMPQQPFIFFKKSVTSVLDLNLVRVKNYDMPKIVFHIKQFVFRCLLKFVAKKSKHIISISKYTKNDLVDYANINSNKITVTYCAAEKFNEKPSPISKLKDKDFIMYVGQSSPYKGQRQLIEAHQQLLTAHPRLHLAIGGKPDKFTVQTQAWVKKNKYRNVVFLGFISDGELAWMYKNTECYVCPSQNEGFGLLNLEAMVYGAPVASSNATCLPEVSGNAANYFDPLNPVDMARAIDEIISNPTHKKELVAKGKKQNTRYSWKKMAKQTLDVYKQVLNQ